MSVKITNFFDQLIVDEVVSALNSSTLYLAPVVSLTFTESTVTYSSTSKVPGLTLGTWAAESPDGDYSIISHADVEVENTDPSDNETIVGFIVKDFSENVLFGVSFASTVTLAPGEIHRIGMKLRISDKETA